MKIVHVVPYIFPAMAYGGPAKLAFQLAIEEQKLGNQVAILTSDSFNSKRRFTKKEISHANTIIDTYFSKNIINSVAYNNRLFTNFEIIKTFLIKLRDYDLFHIHDVYVLPQIFLMYFLIICKKRFIISTHGVLDPIRKQDKSWIKSLFLKLINPCFSEADFIIATSDQEKKQLSLLFPDIKDRIKTIWNGVENPAIEIKRTKSDVIRLLYIGKLHPKKGLVKFIKALSSFPKHNKYFELTIAGLDDGDKDKIDNLITELNISVNRLGFVNEKQKIELYKNHDIFIHPSDSEGFSISIIEALSYGMPIFVTKACNFQSEDLENVGFLIKDNTIEEISLGLNKLKQSKEKLGLFTKFARKLFLEKYTMSSMAKNLLNLIETSFFGIKLSTKSKDKLFLRSFELYFPKRFNNLFKTLNENQRIKISFEKEHLKQILKKENTIKYSPFISLNNKRLNFEHRYLTTRVRIGYLFNNLDIAEININFKTTHLFEISNLLLFNLLKKNLYKQIVKKFIQHPLLLNISINNNLNCLHASALEKNNKVIALVGMNGVGKSTLMANLITKNDYKLFSDNYLLVDKDSQCYRYPSFIRLNNKKTKELSLKTQGAFGYGKNISNIKISKLEESTLEKVYLLQRGEKASEKELTQKEAIILINNMQIMDGEDVRYSPTQLKINTSSKLKFSSNVKFYLKTIKNNE